MANLTPEQLAEALNPRGHFRSIKLEILDESATILRRNLIRYTPRKTGAMQGAVQVDVNEAREQVSLGYDERKAPHAKYVLRGTAPHTIRPRRANGVLRFSVNGQVVFSRSVNHPGTTAQATRIYGSALQASSGPINQMLNTYGERLMVNIASGAPAGVGRIRIG